jgi:hypothetical protein
MCRCLVGDDQRKSNQVDRITFRRMGTLSPEQFTHTDHNGNVIGMGSTSAIAYECGECGALTAQTMLHESWHDSLDSRLTDGRELLA